MTKKLPILLLIAYSLIFTGYDTNIEVINGYTLPPKQDAKINNSTLLGIDSNDNGVRDDVERYIVKKYKNHHKIVTEIGFQTARAFQAVIENPTDIEVVDKIMHDAFDCNGYFRAHADEFGGELLINHHIITGKEFKSKYLNTKERITAYLTYNSALSGGVYNSTSISKLKSKCKFDVEALLGGAK